jgi:hypothetical protein
MAVDPKILAELVAAIGRAEGRRGRGAIVDAYARQLGLSAAQVRRIAARHGISFGYRRRADAGVPRDPARQKAAWEVAQIVLATEGTMPTWRAIDTARAAGRVPEGLDLPVHYVDRYIRDHYGSRRPVSFPRLTRRCLWGEPGACLQADSTNCAQWFVPEPDGTIRFARRGEVYRNKPAKGIPILRYVAADPPTGLFRVRYYQVPGESARTILEFLYEVMTRAPQADQLPMAGVPKVLVLDPGPGNASASVKNLCAELGIEHRMHLPRHAWASGSVEVLMNLWERAFESELRLWPAQSLADLNERAYRANIQFCAERVVRRTGLSRSAFYARAVQEVRLPPPWERFVEAASTSAVERTVVGGSVISYEGREYYCGGLAACGTGDKVEIRKCILDWSDEDRPVRLSFGGRTVVEKALVRDDRGQYRDRRLYEKRGDPVLEGAEAEQAARLELVRGLPQPEAASLARFAVPRERPPVLELVQGPSYRRTPALLRLVEILARDLTTQEAASLGWGETVTGADLAAAARRLSADRARKAAEA